MASGSDLKSDRAYAAATSTVEMAETPTAMFDAVTASTGSCLHIQLAHLPRPGSLAPDTKRETARPSGWVEPLMNLGWTR